MALDVTVGGTSADSYISLADALTYAANMGYVGTFAAGSPLINVAVAADGTSLALDGGSAAETVLSGDRFRVAAVANEYQFTEPAVAASGAIAAVKFTPAAPTGGFADDAAVTFIVLTGESLRRGAVNFDERFRARLKGIKSASGQALVFPRQSLTDGEGNYVGSDTIPEPVKRAQVEMSMFVPPGLDWQEGFNIKETQAGDVVTEFRGSLYLRQRLDRVEELMAEYVHGWGSRIRRSA